LTATSYKYLDIGISVGPMSSVEMLLGDNKGNQIILPHATWKTFIARRADVEKLLQSTAPASLSIRDLDLVKMRDADIVKLTLCDTCMYMKPATVKFKHFVTYLRRNCITNKCDAANILRKICDTESNIECELIAYALDNIVYDAFHEK